MAYAEDFTGGVRVGINDGNSDGIADILTGAGTGGAPEVKGFSFPALDLLFSFYSGRQSNLCDVFVAVPDVNGDRIIDIIVGTGAGPGGAPQVNVFSFPAFDLFFSCYIGEQSNLGADVNLSNKDDTTAFFRATFLGWDAIVKLLLFHGANTNKRIKAGYTGLEGTFADSNSTTLFLNILGIQPPSETDLISGRISVRTRLMFNQFLTSTSKNQAQTVEITNPKEQNQF